MVFFFLSQTESKTVISEIETIHCFVLASAYTAARSIVCGNLGGAANVSTYGAVINPAFAIGINISSWLNCPNYDDDPDSSCIGEALKWIWFYPILPFGGSVIAVIFFEFVYKKTQTVIKNNKEDDTYEERAGSHYSNRSYSDEKKDSLLHHPDEATHHVA